MASNSYALDIATGPAQWICSVATRRPDVVCHGTDLQLSQAPHPKYLPDNLKLWEWNMYTEPCKEMLRKYDLVHLRLIAPTVKRSVDLDRLVKNLWELLKPGGWLQWVEIDSLGCYCARPGPEMETPALDECVRWLRGYEHDKLRQRGWQRQLANMLTTIGFEKAQMTIDMGKLEKKMMLAKFFTATYLVLMEQSAKRVHGDSIEAKRLLSVIQQATQELAQGSVIMLAPLIVTAQKPDKFENQEG